MLLMIFFVVVALVCKGSVFGPCFAIHNLVYFLVLQSS